MGSGCALLAGSLPLSRGRRQHRGRLRGHVQLAAHGQRPGGADARQRVARARLSSTRFCRHLGHDLLALDIAANTPFKDPTVYSYASPRAGDSTFAAMYDHLVPNTFRIANRMDLVPKLPMPPLYDHVHGLYEVNPVQLLPLPPKVLVRPELACDHILSTYLFLLSRNAGGPVIPLEARCSLP
jgi:hypothetical protein